MRFLSRALSGLLLTCLTVALIGFGGWRLYASWIKKDKADGKGATERSYKVDTRMLLPTNVKPILIAYGQVKAWTTLDLRAATTGPITALSPNFRDGRLVKEGEILFTIDPELAERRVVDAQAALAQSKSALAEAKASLALLRSELASAKAQLLVRHRDLKRKQRLLSKRISTELLVDQALLIVKAGEQAVIAKKQGLTAGLSRIEHNAASVRRAELTLKDAQRALYDSTLKAPFSGRLTDVSVSMGRRVAQNEKLGALIDPRSLEAAFPVRNSAYARLVNPNNPSQLLKLPVRVKLELGNRVAVIDGLLDRSSAVVSANQAGRFAYARLLQAEKSPLKPGDFVTIEIKEPELKGVAVVPAMSATADGEILVVGPDNRLKEVKARVLRFQGDNLIIDKVPFGSRYVRMRMPFLAPGVLIKPEESKDGTKPQANAGKRGGRIIKLTETRRQHLKKLVKTDTRIPAARKQEILEMLSRNEATLHVIERLEGGYGANGERQKS